MLGRLPAVNPTFLAMVCGILTGIYAFKPLFTQHKYNFQVDSYEKETSNKSHTR